VVAAAECPGGTARVHGNHQGFYVNQMAVADFARAPDPCPALRRTTVPALVVRGGCDLVPLPVIREFGRALVATAGQFLLILPLAFAEEWGWRGYLLNRLRDRLGVWPALIVIGVICGVWHLPFFVPAGVDGLWPLLPFTVFCVFFGVLLGWLRLASGTIWPAVVGHAVNNTIVFSFVQLVVADQAAEDSIDGWSTGLSGWQGWLLISIAVAVLVARTRRSSDVRTEIRQG
jgi:hypothetical protein